MRLTLIYAGLFLASGAALLAITYVLVRHATGGVLFGTRVNGSSFVINERKSLPKTPPKGLKLKSVGTRAGGGAPKRLTPQQAEAQFRHDRALAKRQHDAELRQLLEQSGVALGIMTALSIMLGWVAAGRVLRPLRTITNAAREISASNLHRRLALEGPGDELTELGNTFDGLLARLEASFAAQRQFVANASHELRTPLTLERTLLEVALSDPNASVESLRRICDQLLANSQHQEELIEALLTLSRSQRGLDRREVFDLAAVSENVLAAMQSQAERRGVELQVRLEPAETSGDIRLAERLIANLVDNGIRHNEMQGRVEVRTATHAGRSVVSVTNSGPVVPADDVERLFQPFERLGPNRTDHGDGIGLGLSIVKAIAAANDASLDVQPRSEGGLQIEVGFPPHGTTGRRAQTSRVRTPLRQALLRRPRKPRGSDELPAEVATNG